MRTRNMHATPSPKGSGSRTPEGHPLRPRLDRRARPGRASVRRSTLLPVSQLLQEAGRMPDAAIRFARDISQVWTPEHLLPLRENVRTNHRGQFAQLQVAINDRFGTTGASDDYVNVFYAAGEMALMEHVGRPTLAPDDRRTLRRLWEHLLQALGSRKASTP